MRPIVVLVILLALAGFSFSFNVSTCMVISSGGTYNVTSNLAGAPNPTPSPYAFGTFDCLEIRASNVILNCNGHTLTGNGSSNVLGIVVFGNNTTVANCSNITNYAVGFSVDGSNDLFVNNTMTGDGYDATFSYGGNTLVGNKVISSPGYGFSLPFNSNNTLINNTALFCGSDGFFDSFGENNTYINNTASSNFGSGFDIDSASNMLVFINNTAFNNSFSGFFEGNSFNTTFIGNKAYNNSNSFNTSYGFDISNSDNNFFQGNNATANYNGIVVDNTHFSSNDRFALDQVTGNVNDGIELFTADNETLTSENSSRNGNNGLYTEGDIGIFVDPSYFCNNPNDGILFNYTNFSIINDSVACNNGNYGIELINSSFNQLTNDNASGNPTDGFQLLDGSSGNFLQYDIANSNGAEGISFILSFGNSVDSSTANSNSVGFYIFTAGSDNITNSSASSNFDGYDIDYSTNSVLDHDNATNNFFPGFWEFDSSGDVFSNDRATGNAGSDKTFAGFLIQNSNFTSMTNDMSYGNFGNGINLEGFNGTSIVDQTFYNNGLDMNISTGMFNMSDSIFDEPSDNLQNFTNLSIYDSNAVSYTINWSAQPAPLPGNGAFISFANKFVKITNLSSTSIGQAVWHWTPSEVSSGGYNESKFTLWKYNASGWYLLNSTPDTSAHTLSLYNINTFSVFGILQNDGCPAPITFSGSYGLTNDVLGASNPVYGTFPALAGNACIDIQSSNVVFDCNGFNITNNGTSPLTYGVAVEGPVTNVTLRNCHMINGYTYGVNFNNATNGFAMNNEVFNSTFGFSLSGNSASDLLMNNIGLNNLGSDYLITASSNNISSNTALSGNVGFNISGSNNILLGNTANYSFQQGFLLDTGSGNLLIGNLAAGNADPGFLMRFGATADNLTGNTAINNSNTGFFMASGGNTLTDNFATLNRGADYFIDSNGNTLSSNNATESMGPGFYVFFSSPNNNFSSNFAYSNSGEGYRVDGNFNSFTGDSATNNTIGFLLNGGASGNMLTSIDSFDNLADGIQVNSSNGNFVDPSTFCNNVNDGLKMNLSNFNVVSASTACNNGNDGFELLNSNDNNLSADNATNNTHNGFDVDSSSANDLEANLANNNTNNGIILQSGSQNNSLNGSNVNFNSNDGILLFVDSNFNVINNSMISHSGNDGLILQGSFNDPISNTIVDNSTNDGILTDNNATLLNSVVSNSGNDGILLNGVNNQVTNSVVSNSGNDGIISDDNTTLTDSVVSSSGNDGILLQGYTNNTATNSTVSASGNDGIITGPGTILTNSDVSGSAFYGILVFGDNDVITNALSHDNKGNGLSDFSNNTLLLGSHLYNNNPDFTLVGSGVSFNGSGMIFDNPIAGFQNYTNISIIDSNASSYSINWSTNTTALPGIAISFANKFVNITNQSNTSINSIVWSWLPSELNSSYTESSFALWKFGTTGWVQLNNSPMNHTLSSYNVNSFGLFAILQVTPASSTGGNPPSGGAPPYLNVYLQQMCTGYGLNVTVKSNSGGLIQGATVSAYSGGNLVANGTTGSDGTVLLNVNSNGNYMVTASYGNYQAGTTYGTLSCKQCSSNLDCPDALQCINQQCVPVQCPNGVVTNHQCVPFQCLNDSGCGSGQICLNNLCTSGCRSDSDCSAGQICQNNQCVAGCRNDLGCSDNQQCIDQSGSHLAPPATGTGVCKDITGCGMIANHTIVLYQCGEESNCPTCSEGFTCQDHQCVQSDISCPPNAVVGDQKSCAATQNGQALTNCSVTFTDPNGKTFGGSCDQNGNLQTPPLATAGYWTVALSQNGTVVKTVSIDVQAVPSNNNNQNPNAVSNPGIGPYIWLLILLVLIILAFLYWRSRGKKR